MRKILIVLANLCMLISVKSQTSVVQDSKGETSLGLGDRGTVAFNAKDESISFSLGRALQQPAEGDNAPTIENPDYIGITVKGKGKSGLANILKKNEFQYDGSIGAFYFKDFTEMDNTIFQLNGGADFLFSQFKLYDSSRVFAKEVYDYNSQGYKLTAGFNWGFRFINATQWLFGFRINYGAKNNSNDLKALEISRLFTYQDTVTKQFRTVQRDAQSAYDYDEYKNNLNYTNVNMDLGVQLFPQILLMFHSRNSIQENRAPQWNPALGIYVSRANAPLEVVAGIQGQIIDYLDSGKSGKKKSERAVVNLVAGFTF